MRYRNLSAVLPVLAVLVSSSLAAAEWGDLTARFVLDGSAPAPKPLVVNKDQQVCGNAGLVDEQLVVNSANNGIANVVVFLYVGRGDKKPPVHESYAKDAKANVRLDNAKCRFDPHIVALRAGQTLLVGNVDPVGHNTNITTIKNPAQNVLVPANGDLKMNFPAEESVPVPVSCNIHPWMKGYVVIKDHPYVGISDKDGNVVIKNLPAGKWTFQVWQEAAGYVSAAKQNGKPVSWTRGRVELTIKPGENDLGEIKIAPTAFKLQ